MVHTVTLLFRPRRMNLASTSQPRVLRSYPRDLQAASIPAMNAVARRLVDGRLKFITVILIGTTALRPLPVTRTEPV